MTKISSKGIKNRIIKTKIDPLWRAFHYNVRNFASKILLSRGGGEVILEICLYQKTGQMLRITSVKSMIKIKLSTKENNQRIWLSATWQAMGNGIIFHQSKTSVISIKHEACKKENFSPEDGSLHYDLSHLGKPGKKNK